MVSKTKQKSNLSNVWHGETGLNIDGLVQVFRGMNSLR